MPYIIQYLKEVKNIKPVVICIDRKEKLYQFQLIRETKEIKFAQKENGSLVNITITIPEILFESEPIHKYRITWRDMIKKAFEYEEDT